MGSMLAMRMPRLARRAFKHGHGMRAAGGSSAADAPVALASRNRWFGQGWQSQSQRLAWLCHRQGVGLANKCHSHEANGAGGLMANTAGLARPIVAVGMRAIAQGSLCVIGAALVTRSACQRLGIAQSRVASVGGHVLLPVGGMAWGLGNAGAIVRGIRMVLAHRHPDTGQQPQGHQAKQETNEQSAHGQIISQGLNLSPVQDHRPFSASGATSRLWTRPAR
jgi:hypothetical protein